MPRICIYTAIYGGYDDLKPALPQDVPCDFICFTDDPHLANPGGWRIIHAPMEHSHPRMRAKHFKLLHHRIFDCGRLQLGQSRYRRWLPTRYAATIWTDGSVRLKSSAFAREFTSHIAANGWAMFRHPDRNCIYPEAQASLHMDKYRGLPIEAQVERYRREGYPPERGLFACTMIARAADADLAEVESAWWRENEAWTYQDQLSLPVVLWRAERGVDVVDKDLWDNEWFDWVQHKSLF